MTSKLCKYCGKVVDEDCEVCPVCGHNFSDPKQDYNSTNSQKLDEVQAADRGTSVLVEEELQIGELTTILEEESYQPKHQKHVVECPTINFENDESFQQNGSSNNYDDSQNNNPNKLKKIINKKNKWKILFYGVALLLIIVAVLYVAFSCVSSENKKNDAQNAKSATKANLSKQAKSGRSDNLGNVTDNISSGSYVLNDGNITYFACEDGIYRADISKGDKAESQRVVEGKTCGLNMCDGWLLYIDNKSNSILAVSNPAEVVNATPKKVYSSNDGSKLQNMCIADGNIYLLDYIDTDFTIKRIAVDSNSDSQKLFCAKAKEAWLGQSQNSIKVCVSTGTSWIVYEYSTTKDDSSFEKKISGNNIISSVVFMDLKVMVFDKGTGAKCGNATIYDYKGGREEMSLDLDSISKTAISGEIVVASTKTNKCYWFDYATCAPEEIEVNLDSGNSVISMGFSQEKSCIISKNSLIVIDIKNNNKYNLAAS